LWNFAFSWCSESSTLRFFVRPLNASEFPRVKENMIILVTKNSKLICSSKVNTIFRHDANFAVFWNDFKSSSCIDNSNISSELIISWYLKQINEVRFLLSGLLSKNQSSASPGKSNGQDIITKIGNVIKVLLNVLQKNRILILKILEHDFTWIKCSSSSKKNWAKVFLDFRYSTNLFRMLAFQTSIYGNSHFDSWSVWITLKLRQKDVSGVFSHVVRKISTFHWLWWIIYFSVIFLHWHIFSSFWI